MIYSLVWAQDSLEQDFDELTDEEFALVEALFDLLESNPELVASLASGDFHHLEDPHFNTQFITAYCRQGFQVARIKLYDEADSHPLNVRIMYAVDERSTSRRVLILGVLSRSVAYTLGDPHGERLMHDYEAFGFPRVSGGH